MAHTAKQIYFRRIVRISISFPNSDHPALRWRIRNIVPHPGKAIEIEDVETRVTALERAAEEQKNKR
jgi:hypothetical protein